MSGIARWLARLEATTGGAESPFLIVREEPGGVLVDLRTGEPVTPSPGAVVIVFRERPDGPQ